MSYYNFKQFKDYNETKILNEMNGLILNKDDLPNNPMHIKTMVQYMLARKHEELYNQINANNVASFLIRFIPNEPIEEIRRKANLSDPVK